MFVKTIVTRGTTYLQIVESYRENGSVKHKVLANLGNLDYLIEHGLGNIINSLQKHLSKETNTNKYDITTMQEQERVNYGYIIYKKLWNKFSLTELIQNLNKDSKIKYDLTQIVFSLVLNRLIEPSSKLYHFNHRSYYLATEQESELHDIYRSLSVLAKHKDEIQKELFETNRTLFNMNVDIVLYDVTTFHFESQRADELREYGFSKANKINEVQVVMGLLVDNEGRPIGYELFPGNTFDGKTMLKVLQKLKQNYKLNQVIIVADKGLNSKINLKDIKEAGFDYIVSARIKNMPKRIQETILSDTGYQPLKTYDKEGEYKYKTIDYINNFQIEIENKTDDKSQNKKIKKKISLTEKLVCSYSTIRAKKDQNDRQRGIDKANKLIASKDSSKLKEKKGYKKYILTKGEKEEITEMFLDGKRIEKEERFDGYYAIEYSRLTMEPEEVLSRYHDLYKIEESFRVLKTTMQTRPIYLRNKEHIEGHFMVCFIAFLLERDLELRLRQSEIEYSTAKIKEAINSLEFSKISIEEQIFYLKSNHEKLASNILSLLKIKQPSNLLSEEKVLEYMQA